uniref:Uncharacterized protein n=1 Tax=Trichogramma kaykai TaxID=54128 RepID=A0ABD2X202_9HYME
MDTKTFYAKIKKKNYRAVARVLSVRLNAQSVRLSLEICNRRDHAFPVVLSQSNVDNFIRRGCWPLPAPQRPGPRAAEDVRVPRPEGVGVRPRDVRAPPRPDRPDGRQVSRLHAPESQGTDRGLHQLHEIHLGADSRPAGQDLRHHSRLSIRWHEKVAPRDEGVASRRCDYTFKLTNT